MKNVIVTPNPYRDQNFGTAREAIEILKKAGMQVKLCLPFLLRELDSLTPAVIATLGNTPLRALLGRQATIGEVHGQALSWHDCTLYPLYHPASLIYNPSLREVYREDVLRLGELMRSL